MIAQPLPYVLKIMKAALVGEKFGAISPVLVLSTALASLTL
jgi:hypothetical protein